MKTTSPNPEIFESTYALLLRSEEKQLSRFETLIYTVLAVSTIFAVLQFGREAAMMPSSIAHVSTTLKVSTLGVAAEVDFGWSREEKEIVLPTKVPIIAIFRQRKRSARSVDALRIDPQKSRRLVEGEGAKQNRVDYGERGHDCSDL